MLDNLSNYKLVLASNSPRRKELLSGLGLTFEVRVLSGIDESYPSGLDISAIPLYIASQKAAAYLPTMEDDELLITADTIVSLDGEVLEKPVDKEDAKRILRKLSGKEHQVITGVCLISRCKRKDLTVTSTVRFGTLSDEEISYYIERYQPYDKAGAYGIQEWIGYVAVESIDGSFYNVMGLPVQRVYQELKHF